MWHFFVIAYGGHSYSSFYPQRNCLHFQVLWEEYPCFCQVKWWNSWWFSHFGLKVHGSFFLALMRPHMWTNQSQKVHEFSTSYDFWVGISWQLDPWISTNPRGGARTLWILPLGWSGAWCADWMIGKLKPESPQNMWCYRKAVFARYSLDQDFMNLELASMTVPSHSKGIKVLKVCNVCFARGDSA